MAKTKNKSIKKANYSDVQRALTGHGAEIIEQLPVERVQLSQPTDGEGARIRVSVEPGEQSKIPHEIILKLGRKHVAIPIEALDDYESYKAL